MDDYTSILLTILVADWPSLITPGPRFVLVTTAAIRASRLVFSTERAQALYERWDAPITRVAAIFMVAFSIPIFAS